MTTQTIIDRAAELLDDTDKNYFTSTVLIAWANAGQEEFVEMTNSYSKTSTISTTTNTPTYTLPTDFYRMKRVRYINSSGKYYPLTKASLDEVDCWLSGGTMSTGGTPTHYYITNDSTKKVGIYPTKGATIHIDWVAKPATMDATSTPAIDLQYHNALIDYIVYRGKEREEKEKVADRYLGKFMAVVDNAKSDFLNKSASELQIRPEM